jgi:hypothetical protein
VERSPERYGALVVGLAIRYNVEILGHGVTWNLSDPLGASGSYSRRVRRVRKPAVGIGGPADPVHL